MKTFAKVRNSVVIGIFEVSDEAAAAVDHPAYPKDVVDITNVDPRPKIGDKISSASN
jgi:hypothetical protein